MSLTVACGEKKDVEIESTESVVKDVTELKEDKLKVTHTGTMILNGDKEVKFELYGEEVPITVDNFVKLVNEDFYNGLIFHRVIADFMIQGGDPTGTGTGGSEETIKGEFSANGVENDITHDRGILSMARSNDPDSASSQFFIVHQASTYLDGGYAAFGRVTEGMDVIDEIATTETGMNDKPVEDQVITDISID